MWAEAIPDAFGTELGIWRFISEKESGVEEFPLGNRSRNKIYVVNTTQSVKYQSILFYEFSGSIRKNFHEIFGRYSAALVLVVA